MTAPARQRIPAWRLPRAVAFGLLAVGDVVVLSLEPHSLTRAVASQILWILLAAVAAASALVRARREPSAFAGWNVLGLALGMMALATASTVVEYILAGRVLPFPRIGDWLQLPAFAAMGFALLAWPFASPSPQVRLRTFVDATLFAVAAFAAIWGTVLWAVRRPDVPAAVWGVVVGQFGIFAVLFGIIAYLAAGNRARLRGPVGWFCAVVGSALLATLAILWAGADGSYYAGHWTDLPAGMSLVLFTFAAATPWPVTGQAQSGASAPDPLLFGGWLTYGSVAVAFGVAFWTIIIDGRDDRVLVAHGFAIITLLVLRQVLAVRDIRRLTTGLEAQVLERTRALEDSQAAMQRAARLEALGRLAGGVAHDFNNLLTGILGYAELIETTSSEGDPRREDAQEIRKSVERGARLTRQLLAFARKQPANALVLAPMVLVTDLQRLLQRLLGPQITLRVNGSRSAGRISMDPGQLEQVIVNMVINARDAMPNGGDVGIEIADASLSAGSAARIPGARSGSFVCLSVTDNGMGMTAEVLARVFEPFFTTKGDARGTGLGLATSYGIINQAGGFIGASSAPGRGTRFDVFLPMCNEPEQWHPSAEGAAGPGRGTETVLLAEDEATVREIMAAALQAQGYTVLVARSGEDAVSLAGQHQGPIDLLLTDMVMPGINGLETATRIAVMRPALRVMVVSGYMPDSVLEADAGGLEIAHVTKPVSPNELARRVRILLDGGRISGPQASKIRGPAPGTSQPAPGT